MGRSQVLYPSLEGKRGRYGLALDAFGGKTSFEVAEEGFRLHLSQQTTDYHVEDWGPWDNSLFGLYRSLVGSDAAGDDFFENLD